MDVNNDLISRSALLEEYRDFKDMDCPSGHTVTADYMIELAEDAPAVDAVEVVRHGYWIPQDNTRTKFMCSDCKSRNHDGSGKYCSQCGCKMDAEVEE